jgi:hypothetical protein
MTQAAQLAQYGANNVGLSFKNRIINGDMTIDQRNNGASVTPTTTAYTLDRWVLVTSTSSRLSIQRSTTAPAGFTNSTIATVVSSYTPGSSDSLQYQQAIEGFNMADFGWGTANAQAVTLSFWVRSSQTGTFSVMFLSNGTGGTYRNYIGTYTINAANTFEQKFITVPGDTTGTWDTGNTVGIYLAFDLGCGSGTATAAGSWANGVSRKATGANTFVSQSNGSTWYVTGVQLEKGTVATSFDYLPYTTELALCQRYFVRLGGVASYTPFGVGLWRNSTTPNVFIQYPVSMRTSPTVTASSASNFFVSNGASNVTPSAINPDQTSPLCSMIDAPYSSGTSGQGTRLFAANTTAAVIDSSAEL